MHIEALVDAGRGLAAFGVVAVLFVALFPARLEPKDWRLDRFTVLVMGGIALMAGFALATIFI